MAGMRFAPMARGIERSKNNHAVPVTPEVADVEDKYTESVYGVPGCGDYGMEKDNRMRLSDE
jgi:hypothetical protein